MINRFHAGSGLPAPVRTGTGGRHVFLAGKIDPSVDIRQQISCKPDCTEEIKVKSIDSKIIKELNMSKIRLTKKLLQNEAKKFAQVESNHNEPSLFGVTDGKAVGTYLEHKFQAYLKTKYDYVEGSSAKGIDFPELLVDMKVTSIK